MSTQAYDKFKLLLAELFMFDQADLDFGIYRIMNAKRDEITRFLEKDLLPQVKDALGALDLSKHAELEAELEKALISAAQLGVSSDASPRVQDLRQQLGEATDIVAAEEEIFSYLYNFFRRYYDAGDFISQRRYKPGVYAIPYEGEEVKLYWANADQYYIKTTEHFRDYAFKLPGGKLVHFKLTEADTELNNNRPANGKDRRFLLRDSDPVAEENGEFIVRFEYQPDPLKRKQGDLNAETAQRILQAQASRNCLAELATKAPTKNNPDRTILDSHLADYTARNTFDYFIHKDLNGFLRRELDFYIKNEVMHLDDIECESVPRVEQYLAKIKTIRSAGHKVIDLLAQFEEFEKKLWLKRKFVIGTNYCVTLDRIPKALYAEIASNDAQHKEWLELFGIDEIRSDLNGAVDYSNPLTVEFLSANPFLVVDTRHFPSLFTEKLLDAQHDLDEHLTGLLVRSENFHGLGLLAERYRDLVDAIYIDPPYNTDASAILYKNDYKDSSWLALVESRCRLSQHILNEDGVLCVAIDDVEFAHLKLLLVKLYGSKAILGTVAVRSNPAGRSTPTGFSIAHDYAIFVGASASASVGRLKRSEKQLARYDERDGISPFEWVNFRKHGGAEATRVARPRMFFPIIAHQGSIRIPKIEWAPSRKEWVLQEKPGPGEEIIWPLNAQGEEKRWKWGVESVAAALCDFCSKPEQGGGTGIFFKSRIKGEGMLPVTWWDKKEYSATEYGTNFLADMLGNVAAFSFPKSIHLVEDCIRVSCPKEDGLVLDYFAGSGTTGHAVLNLNREDGDSASLSWSRWVATSIPFSFLESRKLYIQLIGRMASRFLRMA
jgi:adenine-specific DNA-methyltransferase